MQVPLEAAVCWAVAVLLRNHVLRQGGNGKSCSITLTQECFVTFTGSALVCPPLCNLALGKQTRTTQGEHLITSQKRAAALASHHIQKGGFPGAVALTKTRSH